MLTRLEHFEEVFSGMGNGQGGLSKKYNTRDFVQCPEVAVKVPYDVCHGYCLKLGVPHWKRWPAVSAASWDPLSLLN